MYEGAGWSPAGGDARLLGLEVVGVASAAAVREKQAPLGMLINNLLSTTIFRMG